MDRRTALRSLAVSAASLVISPAVSQVVGASAAQPAPSTKAAAGSAPPAAAADGPFTLPPLRYAADALEPHLDAETMLLHHDRHHAAYVTNLNKAVAGRAELTGWSVERLLRELPAVPEDIRGTVRNHGGGHSNHTLLWTSLAPGGDRAPTGELAKAIDAAFGSFAACQERLTAAALSVFGSGWAWLTADAAGAVRVETTPNQDSPLTAGRTTLLGVDVWEHAYYLKYRNRRADYLAAFARVVDWAAVSARYPQG